MGVCSSQVQREDEQTQSRPHTRIQVKKRGQQHGSTDRRNREQVSDSSNSLEQCNGGVCMMSAGTSEAHTAAAAAATAADAPAQPAPHQQQPPHPDASHVPSNFYTASTQPRRLSPRPRDSAGSDSGAVRLGGSGASSTALDSTTAVSPDHATCRQKRLAMHGSSSPLPPASAQEEGTGQGGMTSSASSSQIAQAASSSTLHTHASGGSEFVPTPFSTNLAVPPYSSRTLPLTAMAKRSNSSTPAHYATSSLTPRLHSSDPSSRSHSPHRNVREGMPTATSSSALSTVSASPTAARSAVGFHRPPSSINIHQMHMSAVPESSMSARSANSSPPLPQQGSGERAPLPRYDSYSVVSASDVTGLTCSSPLTSTHSISTRRMPKAHLKLSISAAASGQPHPQHHNDASISSASSHHGGGGLLRALTSKDTHSFRACSLRHPSNDGLHSERLHRSAGLMSESRGRSAMRLEEGSDAGYKGQTEGSPSVSPNPMPRFHACTSGSSSPLPFEPPSAGYLTFMHAGSAAAAAQTVAPVAGSPVPCSPVMEQVSHAVARPVDAASAHSTPEDAPLTATSLSSALDNMHSPVPSSEEARMSLQSPVVDRVQSSTLPHSHTMPAALNTMLSAHTRAGSEGIVARPPPLVHADSSPALNRLGSSTHAVCTRHVETGLTDDGYVHINQYIVEMSARRRALLWRRQEAAHAREQRRAARAERAHQMGGNSLIEVDMDEESDGEEDAADLYEYEDSDDDEEDGTILGKGSYGVVKKVFNSQDATFYAMKIMSRARLARSKGYGRGGGDGLDAVKREVAIMKKLDHPNIVRLYEVLCDADDDSIYLVMEYAEGGPVMQVDLDEGEVELSPGVFNVVSPPLAIETARRYFRDVLAGLEYLHHQCIVHRDIKPENLLLATSEPNSRVMIADFGVSTICESTDGTISSTAGTAVFMSPEMIQNGSSDKGFGGAQSDIWSLGVTLFFMVFGRLPFYSRSLPDIYSSIVHAPLQFPSGPEFAHVPASVLALLTGMLDKDPAHRLTIAQIQQCPWVTEEGMWSAQGELDEMAAQGFGGADYKQRPPVCETLCPRDIAAALGASKQRPLEQLLPQVDATAMGGRSVATAAGHSDTLVTKLRSRLAAWKREMSRKCDANKADRARKRATITNLKAQLAKVALEAQAAPEA